MKRFTTIPIKPLSEHVEKKVFSDSKSVYLSPLFPKARNAHIPFSENPKIKMNTKIQKHGYLI